jgi:hypothetical protein
VVAPLAARRLRRNPPLRPSGVARLRLFLRGLGLKAGTVYLIE